MNAMHIMTLEKVHPGGIEEWYCPTCGRRFAMTWPPDYAKTVLEEGDPTAAHQCTQGLRLVWSLVDTRPTDDDDLQPYIDFFKKR